VGTRTKETKIVSWGHEPKRKKLFRGDTNQRDKNCFVGTRTKGEKIVSWGHEPKGHELKGHELKGHEPNKMVEINKLSES